MNIRQRLPSQKELKRIFRYDRKGFFVRKVKTAACTYVGQVVKGTNHHSGYKIIKIKDTIFMYHRVVYKYLKGRVPRNLDHINGIKKDNRIENLRSATPSQNQGNRKQHSKNKSGTRGVSFDKNDKTWRCTLMINGIRKTYHASKNKKECCDKCEIVLKKLRGKYVRN